MGKVESSLNRRGFLLTGAVLLAFGRGQGLEGEDQGRFQAALKAINLDFSDLRSSSELRVGLPEMAESGANVPLEIECSVPVKAIYAFCDRNPTVQLFSIELGSALAFYATRIRMAETAPVRVVVATQDGRFLWASQSVQVTQGGCG
jgi:sulfur-oxidizing protein SoxY